MRKYKKNQKKLDKYKSPPIFVMENGDSIKSAFLFPELQVHTIVGDAKPNIAMFQACSNAIFLFTKLFRPDRHKYVYICIRTLF